MRRCNGQALPFGYMPKVGRCAAPRCICCLSTGASRRTTSSRHLPNPPTSEGAAASEAGHAFTIKIQFLVLLAKTLSYAMNQYTIDQIETAINYWREHQASGDDAALCPRARALADVYGLMIYHRANKVAANTLTAEQNDALNLALSQASLPL